MSPRKHGHQQRPPKKHNWGDDRTRGSKYQRGYGTDWQKLRDAYIQQHPLCEPCEERGVVMEAREVHHVRPFQDIDDPLRLDWSNLQSICTRCHLKVTGGRRKGRGLGQT